MGLGLFTASSGLAAAQAPNASSLEGRLLQATDGALYLYEGGLRWRVLPVTVTDAQLAAIPNSGITVERLDQLPVATPIVQNAPPPILPPSGADESD